MHDLKKYALRTFGIEIFEVGLNDDEMELLESIRTHQDLGIKSEYEVDIEFSILCSSYFM